ncbi:XRE family transcriptional regulator [Pontibacillus chungwhensis BH030062]|uniref:XRE family transcriptional regulator n=1 Tax=Pontibacillus chungwhensis BH030062 TaxID=1385513 RepID=A0A0A2UQT0_9BACI|nr:helix-turn-helix transcriptional regulator [Pontibacillus chungwhensis]KGP90672.1 XRE family transcriptional regulator [Pontibacillus chungwhensis BH030062]
MHIGRRIKYVRQLRGLSQSELSVGVVSATHLSNIESGKYVPSKDILVLFADKLEVDEDYLLEYEYMDQALIDQIIELKDAVVIGDGSRVKSLLNHLESLEDQVVKGIYSELLYTLIKGAHFMKEGGNQDKLTSIHLLVSLYIKDGEMLDDTVLSSFHDYYFGLYHFQHNHIHASLKHYYRLVTQTDDKLEEGLFFYNISLLHKQNREYYKAIEAAKECLHVFQQKLEWDRLGETYNMIGAIHWEMTECEAAMEYFHKGEKIVNMTNNKKLKSRIQHNCGLINKQLGDYGTAIYYFRKSIETKVEDGDLHNIVLPYRSLIGSLIDRNKVEEAKLVLSHAKQHCQSEQDQYYLKELEAFIFEKEERFEDFERCMNDLIKELEERDYQYKLKGLYERLGDYYYNNRKYKLAASYMKKEIQLSSV